MRKYRNKLCDAAAKSSLIHFLSIKLCQAVSNLINVISFVIRYQILCLIFLAFPQKGTELQNRSDNPKVYIVLNKT